MGRKRKQLFAVAASAAVAVSLAGCGGNNSTGEEGGRQPTSDVVKGGELHYQVNSVIDHLDPQRIYTGRDLSNFSRLVYRQLVSFPTGIDVGDNKTDEGNTPTPDLATDTGTSNDDATQWMYTLKDGVTWEDGSDITCADLKYGVSRTFAQDIITGGPNYALGYIDAPDYKGPYDDNAKGQAQFDKAITCSDDDKTITYNFKKPWPDFPLQLASLAAFDPFKQSEDKGDSSNFEVFASGPYRLDGDWDPDKGGTFVRNEKYDPATDTGGIRQANPDSVVFQLGFDPAAGTVIKSLIADKDPNAIAASSITPDLYPQITGDVAERATNIESPFTNYLLPNFNQVTNVKVRQAMSMATDRAAYARALGEFASSPADSIVNPAVPGYEPNDAFSDAAGDPEGAKALLEEAGVDLPYPIKLTYPLGSDAGNKAFAALKEGYDAAGFKTTLDGLNPQGPYYPTIQNPGSDSDLIWGGWGADWPSISTVIPPLFDSRLNLTSKTSNGQDYGNYDSEEANALMDEAGAELDLDAANEIYAELNQKLIDDVAYIPLDTTKFYYLRGSNIENYINGVGTSGYPDLGQISIKNGGK